MLKDCTPINIEKFAKKYFGGGKLGGVKTIEWLQALSQYQLNDSGLFRFTDKLRENEPIVYCDPSGKWWTGRYVGTILFNDVSIDIAPRVKFSFIVENFPINNFIPIDTVKSVGSGEQLLKLIQAIQWINLLVKASKHALPVVKKQHTHVKSVIRGRLDVRETIKQKAKDESKLVSISFAKDIENPITAIVVLAYSEIQRWFPAYDLIHWIPEVTALRLKQMIDVIPRHTKAPKYQQLKSARLMPIAKGYLPLARLSKAILDKKGVSEQKSNTNNKTMLIDVAELWEAYVFKVLRSIVPSQIHVQNGTFASSTYLLSSGEIHLGKLIPDYIMSDEKNAPLLVADAKYKRIGDAPWMSPKRDDLYQMTAYINHFKGVKHGVLFYPLWEDSEPNDFQLVDENPWHFTDGQQLSFIPLPTELDAAVALLKEKSLFK